MSSVLIVTDAWKPQVNGVVHSLERLGLELRKMGKRTEFLTPQNFTHLPMPSYPEIRLSLAAPASVRRSVENFNCDYLHIATEGPLGWFARQAALKMELSFTTSYHTRFPEYVRARAPVPLQWSYAWLRNFHNAASACMVATKSLEDDLRERGFHNLVRWSRGVDGEQFKPCSSNVYDGLKGPIFLYVGRVAVEKNIETFLELDLPGTKVVVGGGPRLQQLQSAYPAVVFKGPLTGWALVEHYAGASVFVFPSKTDTFGNVILEALACGTPVAAYPVMGPKDILGGNQAGILSQNLEEAAIAALKLDGDYCRKFAQTFSWEASAHRFWKNVTVKGKLEHTIRVNGSV
ncbi:glycosyltransferase family 4 protein [Flexibacterium corallicola]|uniref:glycosyltransferase family 4 protein n=1 Tax=Flexibacterium corallicola TaxID=3037259 RepID=UPI00286EC0EF|nr:glycosyltransferase family 1 protein [Pseudovibrio sp. M1P-2-3]